MKRLISIVLLICLIAPITGTYLWLKYEKKQTRREVKRQIIAGMDKNDLVILKFSLAETQTKLNWKHSKEFEYKGQMYDVVDAKTMGDSVVYRCWWDNRETKLNQKLSLLVSDILGNNKQTSENNKRLIQFFKSLYHTNTSLFILAQTTEPQEYFTLNTGNYLLYQNGPPVPPPRFS